MKCFAAYLSAFLIALPAICSSGWQVANPQRSPAESSEPFFQAGYQQNNTSLSNNSDSTSDSQFANLGTPAQPYSISVSGPLKENINRIMDRYHWKVIWQSPYDYNFDGRVSGVDLPSVMQKLLTPFPLQAKLYLSNRTMVVTPRKV